jgi:hypothetical protein
MHRATSDPTAAASAPSTRLEQLFIVLLATTSLTAQAEWQVLKSDRDTQLHGRSIAGERMSELRVETPTKATAQQLNAYLLGRYLDEPGDGIDRKFISRSATHAEWTDQIKTPIVSQRCATTRMDASPAQASTPNIVRFESVDRRPLGQPQDCVPLRTRGTWELVTRATGTIVRYTVFTDPGGSVPAFMVRGALETDALQRAVRVAQEASR